MYALGQACFWLKFKILLSFAISEAVFEATFLSLGSFTVFFELYRISHAEIKLTGVQNLTYCKKI